MANSNNQEECYCLLLIYKVLKKLWILSSRTIFLMNIVQIILLFHLNCSGYCNFSLNVWITKCLTPILRNWNANRSRSSPLRIPDFWNYKTVKHKEFYLVFAYLTHQKGKRLLGAAGQSFSVNLRYWYSEDGLSYLFVSEILIVSWSF